jgi:hypothetical protein
MLCCISREYLPKTKQFLPIDHFDSTALCLGRSEIERATANRVAVAVAVEGHDTRGTDLDQPFFSPKTTSFAKPAHSSFRIGLAAPTLEYKIQDSGTRNQDTESRLQVTDYRLQVTGYRLKRRQPVANTAVHRYCLTWYESSLQNKMEFLWYSLSLDYTR